MIEDGALYDHRRWIEGPASALEPAATCRAGDTVLAVLILEGRVASGFGIAREHLGASVGDLICRRTGLDTLVPGTLNLRLGTAF